MSKEYVGLDEVRANPLVLSPFNKPLQDGLAINSSPPLDLGAVTVG